MLSFVNILSSIEYPSQKEKKQFWDVQGILKNRSNESWKFDLRPLKNNSKYGFFKTKADKMVFEDNNRYIVVDIEELHQYLKENKIKRVRLEELISKLDWNIILPKN